MSLINPSLPKSMSRLLALSTMCCNSTFDLILRDLRRSSAPFGGATVLFSGDWRQVGPVIAFGTPNDVVDAAFILLTSGNMFNDSALFNLCVTASTERFRLVQSMRDRLDRPYSLLITHYHKDESFGRIPCLMS